MFCSDFVCCGLRKSSPEPGLCSLAVPYQFLAIEDVNEDKVQDVLFAFKSSNGSSSFNRSCLDEGTCFRNAF